ncbi:MAG: hypothetical protein JSR67_10480 [Proteobacteria bacterium]|nr:hypothetical protein [Pseudomonadota bacterium]
MNSRIARVDAHDEIDLRETLFTLWAKRWRIAISAAAFMCLFAAAAFVMKPVYRSSVLVVTASMERQGLSGSIGGSIGSLGGLASLAGINLGGNSAEMEEALAVLKSRRFTEAFIRDKQLLPKLYPSKWDAGKQAWRIDTKPPTPAKAYKYFDKSIRSVIQDKKTGLITLQIDWEDPVEGAAWANELIQRLNAEMRDRALAQANASLGYLEKELEKTSVVATRDAISRLIEVQIKQRMLANVTEEYAFRIVDRALPADKDDRLRPHKVVLSAAGLVVGTIIGILGVLVSNWFAVGLALARGQK